jgi:hypothetical protein
MVFVSLQPFALRKVFLLVAAVIWLTSTVVFGDPIFMNAHASRFAVGRHPVPGLSHTVRNGRAVEVASRPSMQAVPPAEAPPVSISFQRLDSWQISPLIQFAPETELTFWSLQLSR